MHKPQFRKPVRNLHALGLDDETADVNVDHKGGEPVLVWVADYGTPAVVKALLARGAEVDARDAKGCSALHYVVASGDSRRINNARLLLAAGADVNIRENDGFTPLMDTTHRKMLRSLLKRGATVNATAKDGWTALLNAVLHSSPATTALLLEAGANVHARDSHGQTPLLLVAALLNDFSHEKDMANAKLLLAYGARVNDSDYEGNSVLWYAVRRLRYDAKAYEVVQLILEAGAEVTDEKGRQLLDWSRENGYEEAATLLAANVREENI